MKIAISKAKQIRTRPMPIGAPHVVPTGSIVWPVPNLNSTARYDPVRITLIGATGNQPSQYAHPDVPPMCRATVSPTSGRNDSVAYPGMPPVRSGHMVPSSARHRHRKQPRTVITPIRRMPSAPVPATTKGAMPVTRIVPARPMTNAPHQFVPLTRPFSGMSPSTVDIAPPFQPKVSLEERQVTLHFPVTDDGVPGLELLA